MNIIVIGGGIIGLNCAYYLQKEGHNTTVLDSGNLTDGCSFGNMGYVSPSHFVPLATPGIIWQGIKWMLNDSSPFYIKPRLNMDLLSWGIQFYKSANATTLHRNIPHLNNLLQLSRKLIQEMKVDTGNSFDLLEKGCWMLYKNKKTGDHEKHLSEKANQLGLKTIICNAEQVQQYERNVKIDVLGGVLYLDDCYVDPQQLMKALQQNLVFKGVRFELNTTVTGFEKRNGQIEGIVTNKEKFTADHVVIANGSYMPSLAKLLDHSILMQPGKGYSFIYEELENNLYYPSILADDRVAVSPYGRRLRIGGTMELSGHNETKLPKRITAIYDAFKKYYPELPIETPYTHKAWFGFRPVTPDGMPYIGQHSSFKNLSYAGGHAMLGVAAATGTGKLIAEIISKKKPTIDVAAFQPGRFD